MLRLTQLLLIRHAQTDWIGKRLAGWTPAVHLNEEGRRQAQALGERLAAFKLQAVYSSPLERAVETAQAILSHHPKLELQIEPDLGEVRYGQWEGQRIRKLARTRLWQVIQHVPSAARFPQGESLRAVQFRVVNVLETIAARHPQGQVAVVSHADVLKVAIAHYAGIPLDLFQRLVISPASLSILWLNHMGARILCLNDTSHCTASDDRRQD